MVELRNNPSSWDALRRKEEMTDEEMAASATLSEVKDMVPVRPRHGPQKYVGFGTRNRKPLNGCTQRQSDILRHVVALKYQGYTKREAFESAAQKFEIKPITAENTWYHHPKGIELAEQEHLGNVLEQYHINMLRVSNLLSDAAPLAVETLVRVMKAQKASPNVKASAARDIIKLAKIDSATPQDKSESPTVEALKIVRDITDAAKGNSHVINADEVEDAEFTDETDTD